MRWFFVVLKKYWVFGGRARRTEYWMFTLISTAIYIALMFADDQVGNEVPTIAFTVAIALPTLAVTVRRLHDTDRSGWWALIGVLPCVGLITMVIFTAEDGVPGQNKYGPNPKESPLFTDSAPTGA
ncbi:DUF805 domain-containing protein [Streptomyces sp. NPDC006172]|uniref:DUF805 domain-containing protein n=1 Tax=Streptomyces sp. NPDC006172 TaxID=3154470 RepID=UPI0033C78174